MFIVLWNGIHSGSDTDTDRHGSFTLLFPQNAVWSELDTGRDGVNLATCFTIKYYQKCSMRCAMFETRD